MVPPYHHQEMRGNKRHCLHKDLYFQKEKDKHRVIIKNKKMKITKEMNLKFQVW